MHKFGNSNTFNSFVPVNNTNKFTPTLIQPLQRSEVLTVEQLIKRFERSDSIQNELVNVKPEPEYSVIKEEAKYELLKEDNEIVSITENVVENTIEPIVEITQVYPKENDINIEHAIQKEIKLSHQGYKEAKMKIIVDEILLN